MRAWWFNLNSMIQIHEVNQNHALDASKNSIFL